MNVMENPMQTAYKTEELFKLIPVRMDNPASPSGDVYTYRSALKETPSVNNASAFWEKYKWYFVAGIIASMICLAIYHEKKKSEENIKK